MPARRHTTRKLEVYSLHGRTPAGPINYQDFFAHVSRVPALDRYDELGTRLVAIPVLDLIRHSVFLIAYEGERGLNPLIFNADRARERIQRLRSGEIVATKTHALIDLQSREAILEYNHRGAKASDIARVLQTIGQRLDGYSDLALDLNPVVDEEFLRAIERFERIRLADLKVARPNVDWTENYDHLSRVAAESDARTVDMTLVASRGESLARDRGIIQIIRDMIRASISGLKGARIVGVREGERSETSISIGRYIEHQKSDVPLTEDGHVSTPDLRKAMGQFMSGRRRRPRPDVQSGR